MGTPYISANSKLAYGKETTINTRATINRTFGHFRGDVSLPDMKLGVRKYKEFGTGRENKRIQAGPISRETGSLPLVPTSGELFAYGFGFDTVTGAGPYTHVLSTKTASNLGKAILPTFSASATMSSGDGTRPFQRVFTGCTISDMKWTVNTEQELQADISFSALDVLDEESASPTQTYPTFNGFTDRSGRPYMWYDSVVRMSVDDGSYTVVARVESITAGLSNALNTKRYLVDSARGQNPFEYLTGIPEFTFSMGFVPAGFLAAHTHPSYPVGGSTETARESIYEVLEGQNYVDIRVKLTKPGSPTDSLQFDFTDCLLTEAPHGLREDGHETTVNCIVEPRTMSITTVDSNSAYL